MFFASIVDKSRLDGNLVIRFHKDIRSEFFDSRDVSARTCNVRRQPRLTMSDTFKNAWWPILSRRQIWNPLDTDPFSLGVSRNLKEIINHITIVDIIHEADRRVCEVVCDGV